MPSFTSMSCSDAAGPCLLRTPFADAPSASYGSLMSMMLSDPVPLFVRYTCVPCLGCVYTNAECTPAVTPSVNSDTGFGCAGSAVDAMTMPLRRSAAPSRVNTIHFPSAVVIRSFIDRELATIESVITGLGGVADIDGVDPVAA